MRNQKKLQIEQLDKKLIQFKVLEKIEIPTDGWIHSVRTTLNMTLEQLGKKLGVSKQRVNKIEDGEASGSITINTLIEVGKALEMKFVYGFVPYHESFEQLIDIKARLLARKIVLRTNHNMLLEDQGNSNESINQAVEELTSEIKREMKKSLWD